ncbi:unnamed protein product [Pleuronectes platessa]|uniref:Uncharacterized protein n=1 Tax=Pleuronectes platessa TaxID=8262 RepID=A0A9N7UDC0_PLEPL|nr:unnamed protein product [Pleuronectes platessa]
MLLTECIFVSSSGLEAGCWRAVCWTLSASHHSCRPDEALSSLCALAYLAGQLDELLFSWPLQSGEQDVGQGPGPLVLAVIPLPRLPTETLIKHDCSDATARGGRRRRAPSHAIQGPEGGGGAGIERKVENKGRCRGGMESERWKWKGGVMGTSAKWSPSGSTSIEYHSTWTTSDTADAFRPWQPQTTWDAI